MPGEGSKIADAGDVTLGAAVTPGAPDHPPGPGLRAWRDPVTWIIAALVCGAYFAISLFKLLRLAPSTYDLGIFTEVSRQLAGLHAPVVDVLQPGLDFFAVHFEPALIVLAPFFRVFPSPVTLLFLQALACAVSVFPVAGAGAELAGRQSGRVIGLAYGFSWGLQQLVYYEFHEVALAVPLLAFSLSALVRRRPAAAVGWAAPLVFVKEDQGFTVAAIGLFLVASAVWRRGRLRGNRVALRGGAFLVVWGVAWSALAIWVLIPHFSPTSSYSFWKAGGVVGGGGALSAVAVLRQLAFDWQLKLRTVGLVVFGTAFTALASPVALIALPILALRFLSTNPSYWGTGFHYNATLMPVVFIAAIDALGRWRRAAAAGPSPASWWRPLRAGAARYAAAAMAVFTFVALFKFPVDGLWHGSTYARDAHAAATDAAMDVVPDGATVAATLDLLAPLAARTDTFWIATAGNPVTQYVVFDGVDSGYSPPVTDVPAFIRQLYPTAGYVPVFSRDHVYVFRRG